MYSISCSSPQVILNPKATEFFIRCDKYYIDGLSYSVDQFQRYRILSGERPSTVLRLPYVHGFTKGNYTEKDFNLMYTRLCNFLDNSYILDENAVVLGHIWIFVPCGKCDCCVASKVSSIVQRCQFAQEESEYQSLFVTLTYNDKHLFPGCKVSKRDCQLFFKKLKSALSRCSWLKDSDYQVTNLKWFYSSEYGKLQRPHYHLVLIGFPPLSDNPVLDDFRRHWIIYYAWRESHRLDNGCYESLDEYCKNYPQVYKRDPDYDPFSKGFANISPVESSKSINYILKYSFKSINDKSDTFYGSSVNLGVGFVRKNFDSICSSLDSSFQYYSKIYGRLVKCNLSAYFIRKIFPSESKLIPVDFRRFYINMHYFAVEILRMPESTNKQKSFVCDCIEYIDNLYPFMCLKHFLDPRVQFRQYVECDCLIKSVTFENGLCFEYPEWIKGSYTGMSLLNVLLDHFVSAVNFLLNYDLDYKEIQRKLLLRFQFFSKMTPRAYSSVCDVGRSYSKQNKVLLSKSVLS